MFYLNYQFVPRSRHSVSVLKKQSVYAAWGKSRCCYLQTKQNTLCGQNLEFLNVKPGGTLSNHWAV